MLIDHIFKKLLEYKLTIREISKDEYLDIEWGTQDEKPEWFNLDKKEIYVYTHSQEIEYVKTSKNGEEISFLKFPPPLIDICNYYRHLEKLCNLKPIQYFDAYGGCLIKWCGKKYNLIGTHDCDFEGDLLLCTIDNFGKIELLTIGLNNEKTELIKLLRFEGQLPKYIIQPDFKTSSGYQFLEYFTGKRGIKFFPNKKYISLAYIGPLRKENFPDRKNRRRRNSRKELQSLTRGKFNIRQVNIDN